MRNTHPMIGERVVCSFRGTCLPDYLKDWLSRGLCGGVIFFKDNFESPRQFHVLLSEIEDLSLIRPPLLMIDHEGGRVQRIKDHLPLLPSAMTLARDAAKEPDLLLRLGKRTGEALRNLGFNVNIAPVLDVLTEPSNRVIGDRAYGTTPQEVSMWGIGFAKGLTRGNICPVVKHFPGHGMTREDSHEVLPVVDLQRESIFETHLAPFADAVNTGLPAVMTAHVLYRDLDPDFPATLSKKIISDTLRKRLGFRGVVISDDLEMSAISKVFPPYEVALHATESSTDLLIHTGERRSQEELLDALSSVYLKKGDRDPHIPDIHRRIAEFREYISSLTSR